MVAILAAAILAPVVLGLTLASTLAVHGLLNHLHLLIGVSVFGLFSSSRLRLMVLLFHGYEDSVRFIKIVNIQLIT